LQVVTRPITNTITDYIVGAINSNALAGVEMLPGVADQVLLSAGEKALIKTGAAAFVNGVTSELLGGDFKQGAVGTLVGTALDKLPIPGTADLLGTNKDVSFTSLIRNLADRGLSEVGITDQLTDKLSVGVSKGATAGITTAIAGGDSNDILRNTGIGAFMGTFGDTKIPGTKLTGDDALELIQDSFLDGSDASNALNNAAGEVVVRADVDPLDQFNTTDFFAGSGFGDGDGKKANVTGGSGADTVGAGADTAKPTREDINRAYLEVLGRAGDDAGLDYWQATGIGLDDIINALKGSNEYKAKNPSVSVTGARDSIGDTISDYIDLGGYNDLVTSGSGNDSINAGAVEVTGASDPCENPNQIRDPITGGCYDPIDYVALDGSGTGTGSTGSVTVTAADCNKIDMDYDPIENKCVERVDISKLPTVKPKTPTPPPVTSTKVVDTFCIPPKIRDNVNGGCVCPPGTTEQADGSCKASTTVTAKKCNEDQYKGADDNCYCIDPDQAPNASGMCQDTTTIIDDTCPVVGQTRNAAGDCVCPPGTKEQNGECKPSVEVKACPVVGQIRDAAGNCVCPEGQVVLNDPVSGGQICSTPETTVKGGGGNDTITECPTGYTFSSKTGKCEFDPIGLPSLFTNLTTGGDGPASYTPNLTQPFTASRSYTKPPDTYDYAGADTVGYEDPYFQRFGPIVYTPPAGYLGAGVQPSPAGGTDTDTVDGAGVDTSGGGLAYGGLLSLARGGRTLPPRYLGGITDGMADRVPAHIDGKRPAALSDGEFVIPADVVSHLGNGNSSAGAKILYEMMDRVRKARTGTKKQGREIDAQRFMPR
jgi:hypothetical protein